MAFDPNKPSEIVSEGFDPNKPSEIVEEITSGFDPTKPSTVVEDSITGFDPSKPSEIVEDEGNTAAEYAAGFATDIAISEAGRLGGATLGTAILPGVGTAAGYVIGGLGAGAAGSIARQRILDPDGELSYGASSKCNRPSSRSWCCYIHWSHCRGRTH